MNIWTSIEHAQFFSSLQRVKEAISFDDPIKIDTLVALGIKKNKIIELATGVLNLKGRCDEWAPFIVRNINRLEHESNQKKNIMLPQAIVMRIFSMENSVKAAESMKFYLSSGGRFDTINAFLNNVSLPIDLGRKVQFFNLLYRSIKFQKKRLFKLSPKSYPKVDHLASVMIKKAEVLFRRFTSQNTVEILHHACASGLNDFVMNLVNWSGDTNAIFSKTGATLLHTAATYGHVQLVEWLLNSGANVNARTKITLSNKKIKCGRETPLHLASLLGNKEIVSLLINRRASLETPSAIGATPLHYACLSDAKTAKFLLANGANLHAVDSQGATPLHYACLEGNTALITHLIDQGADLGRLDSKGRSPLQVLLQEGLKTTVSHLFSRHRKIQEVLKCKPLKLLLKFFRQYPEELLASKNEIDSTNPLELPFLFHERKIVRDLKVRMTAAYYERAYRALEAKYPRQALNMLNETELQIKKSMIHRIEFRNQAPSLPDLKLSTLAAAFPRLKFLFSPKLACMDKALIGFDRKGNIEQKILKRGRLAKEFILLGTIPLRFFKTVKPEDLGNFCSSLLIMEIGSIRMPVSVSRKHNEIVVEARIELLQSMLEAINFSDKQALGYRDPKMIIDSGSATKLSLSKLQSGLKQLCEALHFRIPYVGTPSYREPEQLERWYAHLEQMIKYLIVVSLKESSEDPTPWAPFVIELAISGLHCGARSFEDAKSLYEMKLGPPKSTQDNVLALIQKFKSGIVEKMVDLSDSHNVNQRNKILQVIDEACGISESEKAKRFYFNDPIAPTCINRRKIVHDFFRHFHPTAIIDRVDHAVNGVPSEMNRELILDWFSDNIPKNWERQAYQKIAKGLSQCQDKAGKSAHLESCGIVINPIDLKKYKEPNWMQLIESDRKHAYIEKEVQDQNTGKIKRKAFIYLLRVLGIFK